ncbi:hypothetical protein APHAL10511_005607 [Amanita phalloides]|nr:hypothetical protein APHAL10511_005607 [Amanita phalloides]
MDWAWTLSLVFGGCCSNAITLEQLTSTHPRFGSVITFCQFVVVSLYGLPHHITWTSSGPRLKPRTVPLTPYLVQVGLFYLISLLNNAAFAYRVPMTVHIIFRSGGLIVSMLLGWIMGKKYTSVQVASVLLVTAGVALTTLSASTSASRARTYTTDAYTYASGIGILSLALLLSGLLGLVQDWTYSTYTHAPSSTSKPWLESMFYLHFFSLPLFIFNRKDISSQLHAIHSSSSPTLELSPDIVRIPPVYLPLALNTLTQLVCVAGVNRLTTRVSALTVTLILVVRKAVSLMLSVTVVAARPVEVNVGMMWTGAALVLVGTVGYSLGRGSSRKDKKT